MTQLIDIDFDTKRAYLHADTVTNGFDIIVAYAEIKAWVQANYKSGQQYARVMEAVGNIPKGDGTFTPRYGYVFSGWRFVPYDLVSHELQLLVEMISADGLRDRLLFDRTPLAPTVTVDITPVYEKIEIREVNTGSGLTGEQATQLSQVPSAEANADALLVRNIDGGSNTGRQVKSALKANRNKVVRTDSLLTVYEEDDVTVAWTAVITTGDLGTIAEMDPT